MAKARNYDCNFCGHKFVYEERFLKHRCKQMIRSEEFQTPIGQAAWLFYQEWMKVHRRRVPKSSAFLHSKFYSAFIQFATFVKSVHLPDPNTFIRVMRDKDISPVLWKHDKVYALYLEFLDRNGNPNKQAEITIQTLFDLADENDCNVSELFDVLTPNEIIQLLRQRRLSPWILLNSKKFLNFYINDAKPEERIIIESIIRPQYWTEKFQKHPNDQALMKKFVSELNL